MTTQLRVLCNLPVGRAGMGVAQAGGHVYLIGGESDMYLTKQLEAFRSGERRHEQMSIVAQGLSDEDIADLAAWYASIQFEVRMPD